MSERHPKSAEKHSLAKSAELEHKAAEQLKKIERHAEHQAEQLAENHAEHAVEKAREAINKVEAPSEQTEAGDPKSEPVFSGLSRRVNYEHTMKSLQRNMKPLTRSFSKFIHNPTVDQVSEVVGQTIMRPSVSLGATTTAVIVGGFVYLSARTYGFSLQGPEILLAFITGGIIGLLAEALIKLVRQATR